jgi:hypothetical protein
MSTEPRAARTAATLTPKSNRNRQIVYALAIVLLFTAMYPYSVWLSALKQRKDLGEATIGQIDTGSFMLKLALLGGARGVAANVLWTRAIDLQKMHEWDKLDQTVEMITKLQPHFLAIWTFQSWNLAYNVSVEWDDPADKYEWIKRGILFARQGVENNKRSPDLLWDTAWTYYHKLGFSDEAIILRKVLREDDDENFKLDPIRYDDERIRTALNDNFQLGQRWFTRAVRLVDAGESRLAGGVREADVTLDTDIEYVDAPVQRKGRPGDLTFRTMPAHAQTRYAAALEKASIKGYPATFGAVAQTEWERAFDEWVKFGSYKFPAFSHPDLPVQIDLVTQPEEFKKLQDPQRYWADRWANDTNYRYWKDRASAEGTAQGVNARRFFYEATLALKEADFTTAEQKYRDGLKLWADLLTRHRDYLNDALSNKDTAYLVKRYSLALRQLGKELPADTPFLDLYKQLGDEPIQPDPYDALEILGRAPRPVGEDGGGAGPAGPGAGGAPSAAPAGGAAPQPVRSTTPTPL